MALYPITFSIPEEKIITNLHAKIKIMSDLIPGNYSTYIYNTENDYYNEYRQSYFALTHLKSGWDCLRHYEILANGCIPYFRDLENCPANTMALLPKDLMLQGNQLYNKFNIKNINELTDDDIIEYNTLAKNLLDYTKLHLSTYNMAKYILEKSNHIHASKILFLSSSTAPDYLRCLTLHGFKMLLGSNCHDYPRIPHIYKSDSIQYHTLYGKGFTYTNLLDSSLHDDNLDNTIEENIKNKYYDIIIYGYYHKSYPYYDIINTVYKPNEILTLCGEDIHHCNYLDWLQKGHTIFVRELV